MGTFFPYYERWIFTQHLHFVLKKFIPWSALWSYSCESFIYSFHFLIQKKSYNLNKMKFAHLKADLFIFLFQEFIHDFFAALFHLIASIGLFVAMNNEDTHFLHLPPSIHYIYIGAAVIFCLFWLKNEYNNEYFAYFGFHLVSWHGECVFLYLESSVNRDHANSLRHCSIVWRDQKFWGQERRKSYVSYKLKCVILFLICYKNTVYSLMI